MNNVLQSSQTKSLRKKKKNVMITELMCEINHESMYILSSYSNNPSLNLSDSII